MARAASAPPAARPAARAAAPPAGGGRRTARRPAPAAPPSRRRARRARSARPGRPRSAASRWPAATSRTSTMFVSPSTTAGQPPAQVVADHARGGLARLRAVDRRAEDVGGVDDDDLDAQPRAGRQRLRLALVLGVGVGQAEPAAAVDVRPRSRPRPAAPGRCRPRSRSRPRAAPPRPRRPRRRSAAPSALTCQTRSAGREPTSPAAWKTSRSRGRPAASRARSSTSALTGSTSSPPSRVQPGLVAVGHPRRPVGLGRKLATCAPMNPVAPVTQTVTTSWRCGVVRAYVHSQAHRSPMPTRVLLLLAALLAPARARRAGRGAGVRPGPGDRGVRERRGPSARRRLAHGAVRCPSGASVELQPPPGGGLRRAELHGARRASSSPTTPGFAPPMEPERAVRHQHARGLGACARRPARRAAAAPSWRCSTPAWPTDATAASGARPTCTAPRSCSLRLRRRRRATPTT